MGSRALIWSALAAFVIYLGGVIVLGEPPGAGATGAEVVSWFREHRDAARWFVWAGPVSAPFVAVMFALQRRLIPAPHRDVFLLGAVGIVATIPVQSWTWGGLALHADRLEPATARALLDVAMFWGPVLTGSTLTLMAPVTLLALRGEAGLPRWLGVLGAIAIVEQLVETITIFGETGFTEPGGAMNLQLGAGLVWAWILAFAIWGGVRGRAAATVRA
ncbi:MAG TPA: hypothetical protein VMS22_03395 [Candidatus Eisenbacteria bacterium]|nr:hypothetical protein [Candidatus Eisenbacteria bacterium]